MWVPKTTRPRKWVKRTFGLTDAELDALPAEPNGEYQITLAVLQTAVLQDLQREVAVHSRLLGLSAADIDKNGERICELVSKLAIDTIKAPELSELCTLISTLGIVDFQILRQYWGLNKTPRQIEQALCIKSNQVHVRPKDLHLALETLRWVSEYKPPSIPRSR